MRYTSSVSGSIAFAIGVAVDGGEDHVEGLCGRSRALQQIAHADAGPDRRGDELAPGGVADALEGVHLLDGVEIEQLVVGERERRFDRPGDVEPPRRDVDAWLHERRVDGVVILVRGDAWRDPRERVDVRVRRRKRRALHETTRRRGKVAEPRAHGG
jgi:hypothetical protein